MAKKQIIPSRDNRADSMDAIWQRIYLEESVAEGTDSAAARVRQYIAAGRAPQVAVAANDVARIRLGECMVARRLGRSEQSDSQLRQAFAYFYWAEELDSCVRRAERWADSIGDDLLHGVIEWQSLSLACGLEWFAKWVAPHLHNQFAQPAEQPSLLGYSLDVPARRFMELLQRSIITGKWPTAIDVDSMSGYGRLLAAIDDLESDQSALVEFCDWRVANALGYPEMGALKRRRQSEGWSVLDREDWFQVFPIELLTLKYAYERATGRLLPLDAPHPLLQSHLMRDPFPALEPLFEDDLTRQLAKFHAETYGGRFGLRHPIEAHYL